LIEFLSSSLTVDPDAAFDASMLRAALRPNDYVQGSQAQIGPDPEIQILARPFAGDLSEVCLIDAPKTARIVSRRDYEKLGLTADTAFKVCEDNIAKNVPLPANTGESLAVGDADLLSGDFYESSLPLNHAAWSPIAARFGGKLLIAVPDATVVIYANGDDTGTVERMQRVAAHATQLAQKPLSVQVFRWTEAGWEVVSP
jgi:hypothetical protein